MQHRKRYGRNPVAASSGVINDVLSLTRAMSQAARPGGAEQDVWRMRCCSANRDVRSFSSLLIKDWERGWKEDGEQNLLLSPPA